MKVIKVYKRESLFIKTDTLDKKTIGAIIERYTFAFYEEAACTKCEFMCERHSDVCDTCAAFKGKFELAKKVKLNDKQYLKFPVGDLPLFRMWMAKRDYKLNIVDKSPNRPIRRIRFLGTLRDFQRKAVDALKAHKRGVLKSAPRSGKTVMASALICEVGQKAAIIASQRDWLRGFHETFVGSKTQKPLTDLDPKRIGFARTLADLKKYDICLITIQTFYSEKGMYLLKKVRDLFPVVVVDEVHTSAATRYLQALAKLNVAYGVGLSGTPSRKDGKMILSNNVLGPVVHTTEVERLKPRVKLVRTGYRRDVKPNTPWHSLVGHLEKDPKRLKFIAQEAIKDVEAKHMVLIPMARVTAVKALVMAINKLAGKEIACAFFGQSKKEERDRIIEGARRYKIKVIVGNTKLLSTGINIPRASMLYEVAISSNMENCEQRISRILTPWDNKPDPIVKLFLDELNVRKKCMSNEWWHCILPKFKPIISDVDKTTLAAYFKTSRESRVQQTFDYL